MVAVAQSDGLARLLAGCAGLLVLLGCEVSRAAEEQTAPVLAPPVSQETDPGIPPADARPAPALSTSTRARLSELADKSVRAQVPAAEEPRASEKDGFIDRFATTQINGRWYVHERESNGDWAANDWRSENVRLNNGMLSLVMTKAADGAASPYSSGEISTHEKFRYGYFEGRMKVPRGAGVVTGLFTYVRDDGTNATWNEIDIEILGRSTASADLTVHIDGTSIGKSVALPFDSADGFHTYGFEWLPDAVRWYADNVLIHEVTGAAARKLRRPQNFYVDVYGSELLRDWVGDINPAEAPWTAEVTCVAYSPSYEGRSICADAG